jgi:hypothetical protein
MQTLNKRKMLALIIEYGPRNKSLVLLFEEIHAFTRWVQLKPENTTNNKKRKTEFLLSTKSNDHYLTISSDEDTGEEYLFTYSKLFSHSKKKLLKMIPSNNQPLSW